MWRDHCHDTLILVLSAVTSALTLSGTGISVQWHQTQMLLNPIEKGCQTSSIITAILSTYFWIRANMLEGEWLKCRVHTKFIWWGYFMGSFHCMEDYAEGWYGHSTYLYMKGTLLVGALPEQEVWGASTKCLPFCLPRWYVHTTCMMQSYNTTFCYSCMHTLTALTTLTLTVESANWAAACMKVSCSKISTVYQTTQETTSEETCLPSSWHPAKQQAIAIQRFHAAKISLLQ